MASSYTIGEASDVSRVVPIDEASGVSRRLLRERPARRRGGMLRRQEGV
jgi:hypothetical protein